MIAWYSSKSFNKLLLLSHLVSSHCPEQFHWQQVFAGEAIHTDLENICFLSVIAVAGVSF